MARIYNRGNILWIRYYWQGVEYRESLHLRNTKQNIKFAEQIRLEKELQLVKKKFARKTNRVPLSEAAYDFLLYKKGDTKGIRVYENALKSFSIFLSGEYYANEINEQHFKEYRNYLIDKKRSPNTIVTYFNHLKIFFHYLIENKYINKNPVIKVRGQKKEITVIPDTELHKILWYLKIHNKAQYNFIKFLVLTGCRCGEALNIAWRDIEFENKRLLVHNTKARRLDYFPLYPKLNNFLLNFKKQEGKIFNYSKDGLKFWNRALERLKLNKYSLHDLRRKFGTTMAGRGISPFELMKLMRHENIKTTMQHYINVNLDRISEKM